MNARSPRPFWAGRHAQAVLRCLSGTCPVSGWQLPSFPVDGRVLLPIRLARGQAPQECLGSVEIATRVGQKCAARGGNEAARPGGTFCAELLAPLPEKGGEGNCESCHGRRRLRC